MEQADWPDKGLEVRELQNGADCDSMQPSSSRRRSTPAEGRSKEGSMRESQALISATSAGGPRVLYERTENLLLSCM
jgi:hypothetical protein